MTDNDGSTMFISQMKRLSPEESEKRLHKQLKTSSSHADDANTGNDNNADLIRQHEVNLQYLHDIISYISGKTNCFITANNAAQNLAKFDPKLFVCEGSEDVDLINIIIETINRVLDKGYQTISSLERNEVKYPLNELYTYCAKSLHLKLVCLYPLYHGLRGIRKSVKHAANPLFQEILKPNVKDLSKFKSLDKDGYPNSEVVYIFKILFADRFVITLRNGSDDDGDEDDERFYNMSNPQRMILNDTQRTLTEDFMKTLDPSEFQNEDDLSKLDDPMMSEYYLNMEATRPIIDLLKSFNNERCIIPIKKCLAKSIEQTLLNIMTGKSNNKFFDLMKAKKSFQKLISRHDLSSYIPKKFFDEISQKERNLKHIKIAILNMMNQIYDTGLTHDFVIDYTWIANRSYMREAFKSAASELIRDRLLKIPAPVEESLKQVSLYIEQLIEQLKKIQNLVNDEKARDPPLESNINDKNFPSDGQIEYATLLREVETIGNVAVMADWKYKLKRSFTRHYVYYLNYKLKNVVKITNRGKFEIETEKIKDGITFILQLFDNFEKLSFLKLYESLLIPRMLNSFQDAEFATMTNTADIEGDIADAISTFFADSMFEFHLMDFVQGVADSYTDGDLMAGKVKNLVISSTTMRDKMIDGMELKILRMPLSIYPNNPELTMRGEDSLKLPKLMNIIMKGLKFQIKKDETVTHKSLTKEKMKVRLDYYNSKMEMQSYTKSGEMFMICCNMYQGLILSIFQDDSIEKIDLDLIFQKINMKSDVVKRHIKALTSDKNRVLLEVVNDGGWVINEDIKISSKWPCNASGVPVLYIK